MGLESNPDLEFSFRVEFGSTQDWIMQGAPCAIKEPKYHTITRSLSKKKKKELSDIFITLIIALRFKRDDYLLYILILDNLFTRQKKKPISHTQLNVLSHHPNNASHNTKPTIITSISI